jgi:hypothetical protein
MTIGNELQSTQCRAHPTPWMPGLTLGTLGTPNSSHFLVCILQLFV